jgi:hypothetical protein
MGGCRSAWADPGSSVFAYLACFAVDPCAAGAAAKAGEEDGFTQRQQREQRKRRGRSGARAGEAKNGVRGVERGSG